MASHWRAIAPGIDYIDQDLHALSPWSHVHVFRVDLKTNQLDLMLANAFSQTHASISQFAHHSKALITINGGFFDHNYHPLGLRISQQQQYSPLKRISWWGVFYIKDQKPHLSNLLHYAHDPNIDFAIQSGPRLIINGRIPLLKTGLAERSALGITHDGRIILLVTENSPMTTSQLAKLMKSHPLDCYQALNLDGGSSSQLYAHLHAFNLNVHGFAKVSDAIMVRPRSE